MALTGKYFLSQYYILVDFLRGTFCGLSVALLDTPISVSATRPINIRWISGRRPIEWTEIRAQGPRQLPTE